MWLFGIRVDSWSTFVCVADQSQYSRYTGFWGVYFTSSEMQSPIKTVSSVCLLRQGWGVCYGTYSNFS